MLFDQGELDRDNCAPTGLHETAIEGFSLLRPSCVNPDLPETMAGVREFILALVALMAVSVVSCGPTGSYVWVDDYRATPSEAPAYVIAVGDTISVRVFNEEQLSTRTKVRADGKVSLPLLSDVDAAGATPVAFARKLEERLKGFVKNPLVTVSLEETRPQVVYVAGEVPKPGAYPLDASPGVLQAIVNAGGLGPDASRDRIFVLRRDPQARRIRFTYRSLIQLAGAAPSFRLQPGDVVVVE
jgi:polysaccharide biosynthesis/export protein